MKIAEILIANGADMNGTASETLLHSAALEGQHEMINLLVKHGANANAVNNLDNSGQFSRCMPIHYATYYGHKNAVEALLNNGADINAQNKHGDTPLDIARTRKKTEIINFLTANGGRLSKELE